MTYVDISDISIHATRTVIQASYAQLADVIEDGGSVEDFFDYHDDWENDCDEDFSYEIEVSGVVPMDRYKHLQERIIRLEATIEEWKMKSKKGGKE